MLKNHTSSNRLTFFKAFLIVSVLFVGLYHEPLSCAASLFLLWLLWHDSHREDTLQIPFTMPVLTTIAITLLYVLSTIWATDQGMSVFGFVKFLPLPLFALVAAQCSVLQRTALLQLIPWLGVGVTLFTGLLSFFPATAPYVLVNGRLSGTFQYPNTFALFLLVGIILLTTTPHKTLYWIGSLVVLFAGIAYTGSRTVFVLLIVSVILLYIFSKDKQVKFALMGVGSALIFTTVLYTALTGDISSLGRYLTISLDSSTLQGRLLYWQDALPVILRHPFGLGYMGYNSLLGSFQTGVYSLTHVHNEILQLMLDIGWIPAILLLGLLVQAVCRKTTPLGPKLCIAVIFLHSLMDFDLQFPFIWFVLLLCLTEDTPAKTMHIRKGLIPVFLVLGCVCLYFGAVSGLYYTGNTALSSKLYPSHTQANAALLQHAETPEEMNVYADRILEVNKSSSLAWSAKARTAYAEGNMAEMITFKEQAIALAPYSREEYMDYFQMLYVGYQMYLQAGDTASANVCRQRLLSIPVALEAVLENTSERAWMITDKPELTLPEEYLQVLDGLKS